MTEDQKRRYHDAYHMGVLFEECLVCADDKLLFEEVADWKAYELEADELLPGEGDDED